VSIDLDAITLRHGAHPTRDDGMCALEAVAWLAGEPHSDHPQCVCPVVAAFGRAWNDALPSDDDRDRLLKPLLPAMIGTASTTEVQDRRAFMAADWAVRVFTPTWLRRAGLTADADDLAGLPELSTVELCEAAMPAISRARQHADAARAAAGSAARDAARAAAGAAAGSAARDAAGAAAGFAARAAAGYAAGFAARSAAGAAAGFAARDAARAAAGSAARDAARAAAWAAAGDAAQSAARSAAWSAAQSAARSAAGAAAGSAARDAARAAAGSAARDAARAAAWDAAGDALADTVAELQQSAVDLLKRMCEVGR